MSEMHGYYVLRGREAVPAATYEEHLADAVARIEARQAGAPDPYRVARHEVAHGVEVSTVFLSMDHRFDVNGPPMVFETMVFGGPLDGEQDRYSTWGEAERGHAEMCRRCTQAARTGAGLEHPE